MTEKRKPGRPPLPPEKRQTARIEIDCLPAEKQAVIERAKAVGKTLKASILDKTLGRRRKA